MARLAHRLSEAIADHRLNAEVWCEGRSPWARLALLAYLVYAGLRHAAAWWQGTEPSYGSWFSGITLGFHELGHLVFSGFGQTMMLLGGSLLQIAAPLAAALYLWLRQDDHFGLAVGGAWLSFAGWELGMYVYDARREQLPLVGFGDDPQHDWSTLLTQWGVLNYGDHFAAIIRLASALCWLGSVALGGWLCLVMWRSSRT